MITLTERRLIRTALLAGVAALVSANFPAMSAPADTQESKASFNVEEHGGVSRPMVVASFNGHAIRMIVHSNASFYSQLLHRDAAAFGVTLSGGHSSFGIDRLGHVSKMGHDQGTAKSLSVGRSTVHDAPVSVFELPIGPQEQFGMLGLGWIRQNRVILNYADDTVLVAPTTDHAQAMKAALLRSGYTALPMTFDGKQQRYTVPVTLNGVQRSMGVTTASPFGLDSAFASAARVRVGKQDGHGFGPTGTKVAEYVLGEPVRVRIGSWTSPPIAKGVIMDDYGYDGSTRPTDPAAAEGGTLGSAFLQQTKAVVDFGSATLFVRE